MGGDTAQPKINNIYKYGKRFHEGLSPSIQPGFIRPTRGIKGFTKSPRRGKKGSKVHLIPVVWTIVNEKFMRLSATQSDTENNKQLVGVVRGRLEIQFPGQKGSFRYPPGQAGSTIYHVIIRL